MYQVIEHEVKYVLQNKNNMNKSEKHKVNENALLKIHCNNVKKK